MNVRFHGMKPYRVAAVHGGPGAAGSAAALAEGLAGSCGVLEPLQTKDSVDRKEGSGLETVKLLLSRDERYLYALNQGNNTVSAYNVSSSGILSYIGSSELPFCPADAILSPDGNHMIIEGTGNSEVVIMRIKTTE